MTSGELETPGIYVQEADAFPNSVVAVPAGEAAFVGYTQKAEDAHHRPLTGVPTRITGLMEFEQLFGGGGEGFCLHEALARFFANGGATAWIVSPGPFGAAEKSHFLDALTALESIPDPSMLLAPDALRLSQEDYHEVARAMIAHCAGLGSRMAILDLHGGDAGEAAAAESPGAAVAGFRAAMAGVPEEQRSYAAAYHPWIVTDGGTIPPSAALAGLWARVAMTTGVWQTPANMSIAGAAGVAAAIDDALQQDMNMPLDGLAVNAIRSFPGRGILVWGARTLAGNSQDFRYIPVRRTIILIEQSIRFALQSFVFAPNDANTWSLVRAMVSAFLTGLWQQGGLAGAHPRDAFSVSVGLGTTMTSADILDGWLRVTVAVAVTRPAEFITITFSQRMQAA